MVLHDFSQAKGGGSDYERSDMLSVLKVRSAESSR